ncbi:catalase family protein [Neolewinella persica]|uniref:catalase family protein n=1 Tax=Neolewinella persica TaxID=70998 RepID=UPI00036AE64B|nr:catalase family protein [Neolewinella persica]
MKHFCLFLILAFGITACSTPRNAKLATEYPSKSEEKATAKVIGLLKELLEKDYPAPARMERDAHPLQHGLVKAEFIIEPDLPENLKVGIFREAKTYESWIRYSNLSPGKPDIKKDSRGMAIKVMGVKGKKILPDLIDAPTQDFVFMSTQIFVTKDVRGFGNLLGSINRGKLNAGLHFLTHPRLVSLFLKVQIQLPNLTGIEWGSTTPYLLGDGTAVKYAVKPRTPTTETIPGKKDNVSDSYLRERLAANLANDDIYLDFYVQVQKDARKMPIEDPRKLWAQDESPFIKVATIKVLKQIFDTPAQQLYGDNLSFSPWHALPVHRPLGGINRGRRAIYDTMSKFRHDRNEEKMSEPGSWADFKE